MPKRDGTLLEHDREAVDAVGRETWLTGFAMRGLGDAVRYGSCAVLLPSGREAEFVLVRIRALAAQHGITLRGLYRRSRFVHVVQRRIR